MPEDKRIKKIYEIHKHLKRANDVADSINNNLWSHLDKAVGGRWFQALPQEVEAAKKLNLKSYSWIFTATSIGTKVEVIDGRGKRYDVTDYSTW